MEENNCCVIYRISEEMLSLLFKKLNKDNIYLERIISVLDKKSLKNVAGVKNSNSILSVYVNDIGRKLNKPTNKLIKYTDTYLNFWKNQYPYDNTIDLIYGNIIIVLSNKAYNTLPYELKTIDIENIII
jgi:hypothetical protein